MLSYFVAHMRLRSSFLLVLSHIVSFIELSRHITRIAASPGSTGGAFGLEAATKEQADAGTAEAEANVGNAEGDADGPVPLNSQNANKAFVTLVAVTLAVTFVTLAIAVKKNRVSKSSSYFEFYHYVSWRTLQEKE